MTSLNASLDIASSGLAATNAQLALVAHNLANAGTANYVSEQLAQTSVSAGGQGQGVTTGVATRSIDAQLQEDLFGQNATVSALTTTATALQPIDAAQGTVAAGNDLASVLAALKAGFVTLGNDPSNGVQQQAVVTAAGQLAGKINTLAAAYGTARQAAQDSLVGAVGSLNAALAQIGTLSNRIMAGAASGQSTADLQSQRDGAMQTVANLVGARFLQQPNGDVIALTQNGLTLPVHDVNPPFSLGPAVIGAGSATALGNVPGLRLNGVDVTGQLTGGSIGALVALRDVTLPGYTAGLDQFAQTVSARLAGQGLALFTDAQGAVPAGGGVPTQTGYVGYALTIQVNPAVLAASALVRDGTNAVAGSPGGASAFTPNPPGGPAGFATLINRVLDFSFGASVQAGVGQPPIPSTGLGPAGGLGGPFAAVTDLAGAASALVGSQSQDLASASASLTNEQAIQTTLQGRQAAQSAVNTDTELSAMVQLQASYGANAKIFSAVQTMWGELLAVVP